MEKAPYFGMKEYKLRSRMAVLNTTVVPCLYNGKQGILIFCTSVEEWGKLQMSYIFLHADLSKAK